MSEEEIENLEGIPDAEIEETQNNIIGHASAAIHHEEFTDFLYAFQQSDTCWRKRRKRCNKKRDRHRDRTVFAICRHIQ